MSENQPPIKAEDLPYRPCVGVMILNRQGLVWAGRRIPVGNSEYDGSPQLWQMPQGGIDEGEDPLEAAYRELYEETGIKTVSLLAEAKDWINYDLPPQLIGRFRRSRSKRAARAIVSPRERSTLGGIVTAKTPSVLPSSPSRPLTCFQVFCFCPASRSNIFRSRASSAFEPVAKL